MTTRNRKKEKKRGQLDEDTQPPAKTLTPFNTMSPTCKAASYPPSCSLLNATSTHPCQRACAGHRPRSPFNLFSLHACSSFVKHTCSKTCVLFGRKINEFLSKSCSIHETHTKKKRKKKKKKKVSSHTMQCIHSFYFLNAMQYAQCMYTYLSNTSVHAHTIRLTKLTTINSFLPSPSQPHIKCIHVLVTHIHTLTMHTHTYTHTRSHG